MPVPERNTSSELRLDEAQNVFKVPVSVFVELKRKLVFGNVAWRTPQNKYRWLISWFSAYLKLSTNGKKCFGKYL